MLKSNLEKSNNFNNVLMVECQKLIILLFSYFILKNISIINFAERFTDCESQEIKLGGTKNKMR